MNDARKSLPPLRIAVVGDTTLCGEVSAWVATNFPLGVQLVIDPDEQTWALIVCGDATRPTWDASRVTYVMREETANAVEAPAVLRWPASAFRLFARVNEWRYRTRAGELARALFARANVTAGQMRLPDFERDPVCMFHVVEERGRIAFVPDMVTPEGWKWIGQAPTAEPLSGELLKTLGVPVMLPEILAFLDADSTTLDRVLSAGESPTRLAHHILRARPDRVDYAIVDLSWINDLNTRLRHIDSRMSDIVELAGEYVWETDAQGRVTYVSAKAADVHGYPTEYLIGINPLAHASVETHGHKTRWFQRKIESRSAFRNIRTAVRHADGSTRTLEIHGSPVFEDDVFVGFRGLTQDVTHQVESKRRLEESEARYRIVTEFASDMIVQHRLDGEIIYVSPASATILGREPSELEGHRFDDLLHPDDVRRFRWTIGVMTEGGDGTVEVRASHRDGHDCWLEILMRRVCSLSDDSDDSLVSVARDVTERRRLQAVEQQQRRTIEFLAFNDAMTRLPNRAQFQAQLHRVDEGVARGKAGYSVLLIDCDRFKQINDLYGHPIGDEFLRNVASRLRHFSGSNDLVARVGGDEFAVLRLKGGKRDASTVADDIRTAIAEPMMIEGLALRSTVSIGIASCPEDGPESQAVLTLADHALYEAKRLGGNRVVHYRDSMHRALMETRLGSDDIEDALTREHFELHYQPIVDVTTSRVIGVEALVRWHHPERGLLLPHRFIGDAETSRIIIPLGLWVLRHACEEAVHIRARVGHPLSVHVNVSAVQFASETFVADVKQVIEETGVSPTCVVLEITESSLVQSFEAAERIIASLREFGLKVAIDDFGVGYSSLSYLARLPVQCLKIDRSFVPVDGSSDHPVIPLVEGMVELGARLGLVAVGEGIETIEQLRAIERAGCTWQQGFYFAHPQPLEATIETILDIETNGFESGKPEPGQHEPDTEPE